MKHLLPFIFLMLGFTALAQEIETEGDKDSIAVVQQLPLHDISAYPNPFTVKTTISFKSEISQEIFFEIKNVLGKSVYQTKINTQIGLNQIHVFRENLPVGMYIYTLQTETDVISKRLVIK
jgi:hypothetical protein